MSCISSLSVRSTGVHCLEIGWPLQFLMSLAVVLFATATAVAGTGWGEATIGLGMHDRTMSFHNEQAWGGQYSNEPLCLGFNAITSTKGIGAINTIAPDLRLRVTIEMCVDGLSQSAPLGLEYCLFPFTLGPEVGCFVPIGGGNLLSPHVGFHVGSALVFSDMLGGIDYNELRGRTLNVAYLWGIRAGLNMFLKKSADHPLLGLGLAYSLHVYSYDLDADNGRISNRLHQITLCLSFKM